MGLKDNFNIAPDNKGGRPEKSQEEEDTRREAPGEPYPCNDEMPEGWWSEQVKEVFGASTDPDTFMEGIGSFEEKCNMISQLAGWVSLNPIDCRKAMADDGFYQCNWQEYRDEMDEKFLDARVPGIEIEGKSKRTSFGRSSSSSKLDSDSGLGSLITDAK